MAPAVRAGIIGTGFMGTVHARSIPRAGGVITRIVGSSPASSHAAAQRVGATTPTDTVEQLLAADDVDIVHICTPNATHAPLVRAAIAAGKHVICEKPLAVDVLRGAGARRPAAERQASRQRCRSSTASTPPSGRPGPGSPTALSAPSAAARLVPAGLAGLGHRRRLAGRRRSGRCLPRLRRHRGALVRSHRIRLRPPHLRLSARTVVAVPNRGGRPVQHRGRRRGDVRDRPGRHRQRTISQVSHGRKNRLSFTVDGAAESLSSTRRTPRPLWIGGRDVNRQLLRGTGESAAAARATRSSRPATRRATRTASPRSSPTPTQRSRRTPDGLPTFADGLRAARLTQAVLDSLTQGQLGGDPAVTTPSTLVRHQPTDPRNIPHRSTIRFARDNQP